MISVSQITLAYSEKKVLTDFSAEFDAGTITAIVGANGGGKSTLLAALAGDIAPQQGEISLQGRALSSYSQRELSRIRSVAAQSHTYWMSYSSLEILRLGYEDVPQARFEYVIDALNLKDFLEQSVTTLSGGQLQRIEIARALLRESPLLLLDEPFASQDLQSIAAIQEVLIKEKSAGRTVILVAHANRSELSWCDQIVEITAK